MTAANPIRTLIVDDEPLARRGLELRLAEHADIVITGRHGDGASALAALREQPVDLVFLDIQMPGMDGFQTLAAMPPDALPMVVFVTAYDQYALRAFEATAVDYLLKPVDEDRLRQALDKVRETRALRSANRHCAQLLGLLAEIGGRPTMALEEALQPEALQRLRDQDWLVVRDGHRSVRLELADIRWIDAAGDYLCLHVAGDTVVVRATMTEMEKRLDPQRFPRIHRSTIVNARRIRGLRPHGNGEAVLTLDCGHELKISRSYRDRAEALLPAAPPASR